MLRPLVAAFIVLFGGMLAQAAEIKIPRRLPPQGKALQAEDKAALTEQVTQLRAKCEQLKDHPLLPDAEILVKAVEYALLHGEFYKPTDAAVAQQQLKLAAERLAELEKNQASWAKQSGLVVRGYRSAIDNSAQPYGIEIPADLDLNKPVPLYVWLHGRGDSNTDMHFIKDRLSRGGRVNPPGAIVVHPFGRHCVGFKSAGEIDVLDVVSKMQKHYNIDPNRIVLMGFSMGGAGCWHIGAHYPDRWVAMSPGAGFAETARYQKLKPENFPPKYEQTLWGLYDVPDYVRNLFNLPVIAYSGEVDPQMQAALVMEEAFADEGRTLPHLIGPGMGHKYHPDTLAEILKRIDQIVQLGRDPAPANVSLQTKTLRYNQVYWVEALGLEQHWQESRIDAEVSDEKALNVSTHNITALRLSPPSSLAPQSLKIDGQTLGATSYPVTLQKSGKKWSIAKSVKNSELHKSPGLQGPIDDVFYEPFLIVTPTGQSKNDKVEAWVKFELAHQLDRWRALFRGEPPVKRDVDVTADDLANKHLVLWGDVDSNKLIAQVNDRLPVKFAGAQVTVGGKQYDRASHVPVLIYPNPLNPQKYVVLNSGMTYREDHDRTNSLQNPKLPDWAVLDITVTPSGSAAGGVVATDFFDENWQLKSAE